MHNVTSNGTVKIYMAGRMDADGGLHCAQEDIFIPTLSVWETIEVTAKLRLPDGISRGDRRALILDSLRSMGLQKLTSRQARH